MSDGASSLDDLTFRQLRPGEPAPWFVCATTKVSDFHLHVSAGRYMVLCFFGTAGDEKGRAALSLLDAHRHMFDDDQVSFFGVSADPEDRGRLVEQVPGVRFFLDFDRNAARLYGAAPLSGEPEGQRIVRRQWYVLDPQMRIIDTFLFAEDGSDRTRLLSLLAGLPPVDRFNGVEVQAPVLYLPNVFEPELCADLIAAYEAGGGEVSGFMRDVGGLTTRIHDASHKVRRDHELTPNSELYATVRNRVHRRIVPQIQKAYQFDATRMERYLVACYAAEDGGHFRPHRDNTTKGTAHRRFAVSINLNSDFEGGEIGFPEFGTRTFKPPPGGAVVFSCSLLHRVSRVTRGRRYAFLPFLYDDAAAALREENRAFFSPELAAEGAKLPAG